MAPSRTLFYLMDRQKAKIALEAGVCTPAAEKVIESNTLFLELVLKADLQVHMRSHVTDLLYWKNAIICIMEKSCIRNHHTAGNGEYSPGRSGRDHLMVHWK